METKLPECPECEKLTKVADKSNIIGAFLDWLNEKGYVLSEWDDHDKLYPVHLSIEKLLAKYFNIDLVKVEKERSAWLEQLRGN